MAIQLPHSQGSQSDPQNRVPGGLNWKVRQIFIEQNSDHEMLL